jgi:hypothetical protein
LLAAAPPAPAATGWHWPVAGQVITPYRNGEDPYAAGQHRGIDIAAAVGTPVVAAASGQVRFSGVAGSSGLTVSIRTVDGALDTSYLHLQDASVREGDSVAAGQRVGSVGTSGRRSAAAPHLHFGVREAGSRHAYRDPLAFLPPQGPQPAPEGPRGAPAPVPVPVRPAPAPAPRRVPTGRRAPAPAPKRRPVPARRPTPRGAPGPAAVPAPIGAPALDRAPVPAGAPTAAGAPSAARPSVPRSGPSSVPRGASSSPGAPAEAEANGVAGRAPDGSGSGSGSRAGGPDLGWALACLGLLMAALCIGTARSPSEAPADHTRAARARIAALLRPLRGRG